MFLIIIFHIGLNAIQDMDNSHLKESLPLSGYSVNTYWIEMNNVKEMFAKNKKKGSIMAEFLTFTETEIQTSQLNLGDPDILSE